MTNDIDINEELKLKHQEMLLNKKLIDIDTSVDSLLLFINNYFESLVYDIDNKINDIKGTAVFDEVLEKIVSNFLKMVQEELKNILNINIEKIKNNVGSLTEEDYNKQLSEMTMIVSKHISDFYLNNVNMLIDELTIKEDVQTKERINNFLSKSIYLRIMTILKNQLSYSIKVIDNNYEENYQIIQSISEKTLKQV